MAVQQTGRRKWRATIRDPETGKRVSVAKVLGLGYGESTFETKRDALTAYGKAKVLLYEHHGSSVPTVQEFWETWTTDPVWARPKKSTNVHNRERSKGFVAKYGHLRMDQIDDDVVSQWRAGGEREGTISVLRAMFNDACSRDANRLIAYNPFAGLRVRRGRGRQHEDPPSEEMVWAMIAAARKLSCPGFAAWLQTACFTGMRPGELDALKWDAVDLADGWITVREQWSPKAQMMTLPKNGQRRRVPLHAEARQALLDVQEDDETFCFVNLQGNHWTPGARAYHWNAVRAHVGWDKSLYGATRHFAGHLMYVTMGLPDDVVGHALGHTGVDPGLLTRTTYGHRGRDESLERVKQAFAERSSSRLRVIGGEHDAG